MRGFGAKARGASQVRQHRHRARVIAVIVVAAAALTATTLILASGSQTSRASAIEIRPDGSVLVTIREAIGVDVADQRLIALGVPVRVVHFRPDCRARRSRYAYVRLSPAHEHDVASITAPSANAALLVRTDEIPAGDTIVIAARQLSPGPPVAFGLVTAIYRGATPPCIRG
jgi:hypothetical protein